MTSEKSPTQLNSASGMMIADNEMAQYSKLGKIDESETAPPMNHRFK